MSVLVRRSLLVLALLFGLLFAVGSAVLWRLQVNVWYAVLFAVFHSRLAISDRSVHHRLDLQDQVGESGRHQSGTGGVPARFMPQGTHPRPRAGSDRGWKAERIHLTAIHPEMPGSWLPVGL